MLGLSKLYHNLVKVPLRALVRIKSIPEAPVKELEIDLSKPIYYVLRTRSSSSFAMLAQECKRLGLPEPQYLSSKADKIPNGGVFFIEHKQIFGRRPTTIKKYRKKLESILEQHFENDTDTQLVPVSIYWGRNPGKEKSWFRLFFTDTESATPIRKFFILLFQGRNSFIRFGRPLQLNLIKQQSNYEALARKVSRVLRVYFHRQWTAAMGPLVANRKQMLTSLMANDQVIEAIKKEQKSRNISYAKAQKTAYKYADEIAASYSYRMILFLSTLLGGIWNKLYNGIKVQNASRVRDLASEYELVYMPCHRSHIDYLLISYTLYHQGLVPPHIAAGINLNFWPVGGVLRRAGAFYIRRSFRGNKLYTTVFNEYLRLLFDRGYPVEFYPEGGRSRTGRLLQPKTGMLSMTVQSALRGCKKPIMLIPTYVGYERMMEGKSYISEMRGKQKKKESMGQLLKVRKQLKQRFGQVYVSFGEPVSLEGYLDQHQPDWRDIGDDKPSWLNQHVTQLSDMVMNRINNCAVVNPVNIISLILLSTQRHTMGKQELLSQVELYLSLLRKSPYDADTYIPEDSAETLFKQAASLETLYEFDNPLGNLCQLDEKNAVLLTYYRNNILHLFAISSLIAINFRNNESLSRTELVNACKMIYPLLKRELTIKHSIDELDAVIDSHLSAMAELSLLSIDGDTVQRPDFHSESYSQLMLLASTLNGTLERYGVTLTLLSVHAGRAPISRAQLETQSQKLTQRLAALYNIYSPESFDKKIFQQIVSELKQGELIENNEQNELVINDQLTNLTQLIMSLLTIASQESLSKAARWSLERWQTDKE
ncbi:glycerol-3-phosphate 1-O-acyltransferase PlsB [Pleionea sp. CnH1-48]|uniref:glycerol-3-phosphate 1-O-acyltransferase PlsB n=1 Tax=Pleionea sp. CnH1-48 TaxID=2954494 RepID=UPI002096E315|nr:glycerol-3-phosphate 1-O-acyltransferase PlsB [Pleionea sp. CnH1-48]MCO7224529.1 glycerol-3-phosphate 1-O-acyltransferase PlsB [Pleionea sp. CnH1-48]